MDMPHVIGTLREAVHCNLRTSSWNCNLTDPLDTASLLCARSFLGLGAVTLLSRKVCGPLRSTSKPKGLIIISYDSMQRSISGRRIEGQVVKVKRRYRKVCRE
jgi:hypothetical protein